MHHSSVTNNWRKGDIDMGITFNSDIFDESVDSGETSAVIQEGKFKDIVGDIVSVGKDIAHDNLHIDTDRIKQDWKKKPTDASDVISNIRTASDATSTVAGSLDAAIGSMKSKYGIDGRSIVARSRNSIKQFPIYITQTTRVTVAHLLGKMFEKVYATFLQAALSQNPYITPEEVNELKFLNRFHTDIRESAQALINEFYQPVDDFDAMMQESVYCEQKLSENCTVRFSVIPSSLVNELVVENARLMNEPVTGIPYLYNEARYLTKSDNDRNTAYGATKRETSTNSETTEVPVKDTWKTNITRVDESELEELAKHRLSDEDLQILKKNLKEIESEIDYANPLPPRPNTTDRDVLDYWRDECQTINDTRNREKETAVRNRRDAETRLRTSIEDVKRDIRNGTFTDESNGPAPMHYRFDPRTNTYYKNVHERNRQEKSTTTKTTTVTKDTPIKIDPPEFLRQSDIKKVNGMDPYMLKATFIVRDPETKSNTEITFVIGVKSVMHLIYAQDLADELYELVTGNVKSLQKVRYKTGEIKWSDYMFNSKGLKADAAKGISYNKRWIATLKELANFNKTNGSLLKKPVEFLAGKVPLPNATLILSQTDVTWLVNKTGIDLSQISNARKLASSLFLIAIAIVDETAGSIRIFFPDRDTDWDVQSLASIDAEVARTDNSNLLKELNKAVNR